VSLDTLMSGFVPDFIQRLDGPLHFRFLLQPLVAIVLAARDGARDAREGRGAYGWSLLTDPAHRRYLLEDGWKGVCKVFIVAYALDVVYQLFVWHGLKPLQAVATATLLALLPYVLLRGPINRLLSLFGLRSRPA